MKMLCHWIDMTGSGSGKVLAALASKKVKGFKDGIEHYSAIHAGCNHTIAED